MRLRWHCLRIFLGSSAVSIIHLHHPWSQQHPSSTQFLRDTSEKRHGLPQLTDLQTERERKLRQTCSQLGAHPHCTQPVLVGPKVTNWVCWCNRAQNGRKKAPREPSNQPTDRPSAHAVGVPCGWGAQTPWVCATHL